MQVRTKYFLFLCFIHATMKQLWCLQELGSEIHNPHTQKNEAWEDFDLLFQFIDIYLWSFKILEVCQ